MTDKVDFKKTLDSYRAPRDTFRIVDVPELQYLMIDGHGDPNTSSAYTDALASLYPVAYRLKFISRRELERDYVVPPLEGLWWADDMDAFSVSRDKSQWDWTMMLMVPDWLDPAAFRNAVDQAGAKNPPVRLDDVRLETLSEGRCVQTLHLGSFDDEGPVLERMHREFIPEHDLRETGKHHEIYFSDFRKVTPDKLRTVLRQPVGDLPAT
ncbi:GyrI-like domain-containing protein [Brevibacterium atlanticum]|uniref:GyrI-like domain-containing protein n=1 Tax=Brevibacterium atlanticum TaxID=2697563 RepID=UPI0014236CD0|nr:GyrI-like domain-containing protein [Brevibacterium atlanticum]